MSQRWASLWAGPYIGDSVEFTDSDGCGYYGAWYSTQLYALDREDRAWTLCRHNARGEPAKWLLVDDVVSGAAGRQWLAERAAAKEPDGT